MKMALFAILILFGATANAQVCGLTTRDSIASGNNFEILVHSSVDGSYQKKIVATSAPAASEFLSIIALHGGRFCSPDLAANAPFIICFEGDETNYIAEKVYCGKQPSCEGPYCGGNGVSVNSGSAL